MVDFVLKLKFRFFFMKQLCLRGEGGGGGGDLCIVNWDRAKTIFLNFS